MTSWLSLIVMLLMSLATVAQQTAAPAAGSGTTYSVAGVVQNSVTGEPIPHALVQISGAAPSSTFSDAAGRFQFEHVQPGISSATARKPGFLSPSEIDPVGSPEILQIGSDTPPALLKLIPQAVVFGRAQRPDGEPVGYLSVQLLYFHIADGRKRWDLMNSTQTNDEGEFRIAGLRPGRYFLQAGPRFEPTFIGQPGRRAREAAYRPVFYPGVNDLGSATPIDVSPGQQFEAELALAPDPVFSVSGTITGVPPGNSVEEVWPRIEIAYPNSNFVAVPIGAEPGNEFHGKVPAGMYVLRAEVDTSGGSYRGEMPINVQSDVPGITLLVAPVRSIRVEVTVQRTAPGSGRRPQLDQANLQLHGEAAKLPASEQSLVVSSGRNNLLQGLEPGSYLVDVVPVTPDLYVDSVQCGVTDLLRDNLTIGQDPGAPIRISLRDDGGKLSGSVVSDGHPAKATVLLFPDRAPKQVKTAEAGSNGQFTSSMLAPGDYTVFAFDTVAGLEYTNPDVMNAYSSNATRVSVAPSGEIRVTVNLSQAAK
jgi:hypothetical protein